MNRLHSLEALLRRNSRFLDASEFRRIDSASQVVVFGSMSCNLETPESDLDILCVAEANRKLKKGLLEIIYIQEDTLNSETWRSGELASHIAAYGMWLRGDREWTHRSEERRVGKE